MKLLAFDLDGTIVNHKYELTEPIIAAIQAAREAGHLVTVITGRVHASAKPYLDQLKLETPIGTAQGGCVTAPDGSLMRDLRLTHADTRAMIERYAPLVTEFFVPHEMDVYVKNPHGLRNDGKPYWDWIRSEGRNVHEFFATFPNAEPAKLTLHSDEVYKFIPEIRQQYPTFTLYPWGDYYLEIAPEGAHKGAALELIANHLGIAQKDTIAFGDGNNDLTMLEWAGHGVAVGEVEAHHSGVAQETIPAPEEFGVATWLEQFLAKN